MPSRRSRRSYYNNAYDSRPHRRRGGCLESIRRFFVGLFTTIFIILGAIILIVLTILIIANGKFLLSLLPYLLIVVAVFALLGLIYLLVRVVTAISHQISGASMASAKARIEKERVKIERERVQQARVGVRSQASKLDRDEYAFYERYERPHQEEYYMSPKRTKVLPQEQEEEFFLPEKEPEPRSELEIMGMPSKGQTFLYQLYKKLLNPGEVILGIRADGSARVGSWQELKILLILGASSSGKSTTVLEKCKCIVDDQGLLIICDPGGFKPDSLVQRLGSLQNSIVPGTQLAIEHEDIMSNVQEFAHELERRRRGADMTTPILLVIDELNGLLMDKEIKKELTELIEKFAQQARGYHMYMILCAQRVSGLAAIRNSVISYICHKCPEMEASKLLPARYAKLAPQLGVGQTFVSDADGFIEPLQQTLIRKKDLEDPQKLSASIPPQQTARQFGAPARPQRKKLDHSSPAATAFSRVAPLPQTWGDTQPMPAFIPNTSPIATKMLLGGQGATWMSEDTQPQFPFPTEPLGGNSPSSPISPDPFEALAQARHSKKRKV